MEQQAGMWAARGDKVAAHPPHNGLQCYALQQADMWGRIAVQAKQEFDRVKQQVTQTR